jgi:hypothetical protein
MNAEHENFDQIQRMLKLKRHEQPPPRYFNDFSSQVIARIRAGEAGSAASLDTVSWMQRLREAFTSRAGLSGSFAAAVCAVFIGGIIYSDQTDGLPPGLGMTASAEVLASASGNSPLPLNPTGDLALLAASSTNPIVQPTGSLFDRIRLPAQPVPVAFQLNRN